MGAENSYFIIVVDNLFYLWPSEWLVRIVSESKFSILNKNKKVEHYIKIKIYKLIIFKVLD